MPRRIGATLAAVLVVAGSGTADAADIYAKAGGTSADQATLIKDCVAKADKMPADYFNPFAYGATSPAALIAVSVVGGFMEGVHESRERRRFEDRCMRKAGWARIKLTDVEQAAFDKAGEAARDSWIDSFLKSDISERVTTALKPKAQPLPAAGKEAAVGGVLFDPAALVPIDGAVGKDQALLTGKAAHRRTATLREDASIPIGLGMAMHVTKGTVFHQVELRAPSAAAEDETSPFWCGRVKGALAGTVDECVWTDFEGYHEGMLQSTLISESGYRDWLVSAPNFQQKGVRQFPGPFALDVSDTDLMGPMDVALKLDHIDKAGVWLVAIASRGDGKDLPFWKGFVPMDSSGKAVVPLWTHRLTLMVQGDKASCAYTADGDGTGLADVLKAPPRKS